jgi:acyl-CoA synthetase (NDP forming)
MSQYNLNRIFKPCHFAVIGAGEKTGTINKALTDAEFLSGP